MPPLDAELAEKQAAVSACKTELAEVRRGTALCHAPRPMPHAAPRPMPHAVQEHTLRWEALPPLALGVGLLLHVLYSAKHALLCLRRREDFLHGSARVSHTHA